MATSNESLVNIIQLVSSASPNYFEILKSRRMIVFSERIKSTAKNLGFKKLKLRKIPLMKILLTFYLIKSYKKMHKYKLFG